MTPALSILHGAITAKSGRFKKKIETLICLSVIVRFLVIARLRMIFAPTEVAMSNNDLIKQLKRLAAETGCISCLGCGYEYNCGIHGCRVIKEAVKLLEELLHDE